MVVAKAKQNTLVAAGGAPFLYCHLPCGVGEQKCRSALNFRHHLENGKPNVFPRKVTLGRIHRRYTFDDEYSGLFIKRPFRVFKTLIHTKVLKFPNDFL